MAWAAGEPRSEVGLFTDHYAQPSCTAGRAAFITGQPGAPPGLQAASPSLAELLKAEGYYRTGQFGKNHLGDRNEHLPTAHGFDEFFGNLYHLNTQEEAEQRDYQAFAGSLEEYEAWFGARGVLHTFATDVEDPTDMPRFGVVGKQTIKDSPVRRQLSRRAIPGLSPPLLRRPSPGSVAAPMAARRPPFDPVRSSCRTAGRSGDNPGTTARPARTTALSSLHCRS